MSIETCLYTCVYGRFDRVVMFCIVFSSIMLAIADPKQAPSLNPTANKTSLHTMASPSQQHISTGGLLLLTVPAVPRFDTHRPGGFPKSMPAGHHAPKRLSVAYVYAHVYTHVYVPVYAHIDMPHGSA